MEEQKLLRSRKVLRLPPEVAQERLDRKANLVAMEEAEAATPASVRSTASLLAFQRASNLIPYAGYGI